ncbi:MAG: cation transporter [Magnetococcales bacterium]|nr:cation transporter [Magnetococcales bacterium]
MTNPQALKQERYLAARKATLLSVAVNIILSIGKVIAGILGNSAAMLADGIHSASDLVTDGVVLVSMRMARKEADTEHPYGHGKFETLATQLIAIVLLIVAIGICFDAVSRLRQPDLTPPTSIALLAAFISLISKEALFQYTIRVGRRLNAKALIANAWHQRSDAISSIAALIGIAGAMMGWPIFDPLAAIAVAFILGKVGAELIGETFSELTDSTKAIDQEIQERIFDLVHEVPEVLSAHFITPRRLGPDIYVDVHVVVPKCLTVSEGHQIAEKVRHSLLHKVDAVTDAMVHIDTEDDLDEDVPILSSREDLLKLVNDEIPDKHPIVGIVRLHPNYTMNGIILDLVLEVDRNSPIEQVHADTEDLCTRLLDKVRDIIEVRTSLSSSENRRMILKETNKS